MATDTHWRTGWNCAVSKARTAYQEFFALWKDADPDIPILKTSGSGWQTATKFPSKCSGAAAQLPRRWGSSFTAER
jgi:hypothetical protein